MAEQDDTSELSPIPTQEELEEAGHVLADPTSVNRFIVFGFADRCEIALGNIKKLDMPPDLTTTQVRYTVGLSFDWSMATTLRDHLNTMIERKLESLKNLGDDE